MTQQEEIEQLKQENAALLKQWNDIDLRNELRHREWSAQVDSLNEEIVSLKEKIDYLVKVGKFK